MTKGEKKEDNNLDNPIGPYGFPHYNDKYNLKLGSIYEGLGKSNFIFNTFYASHYRIVDSGASKHISGNASLIQSFHECPKFSISLLNGKVKIVSFKGDAPISDDITLIDVYSVPSFQVNLLSISKLTSTTNFVIQFPKICASIFDKVWMRNSGQIEVREGLYLLQG